MVGYLTAGCHARKPRAYAVAREHGAVFHRYPAYFDWRPLSAVRHVICRHDESPRAAMRRVANDRAAASAGAKGFTSWSARTADHIGQPVIPLLAAGKRLDVVTCAQKRSHAQFDELRVVIHDHD